MTQNKSRGVWDASECALLLIDYQEHVLDAIFEQDRRVVELNARTLAKVALDFKIPVILSTVGVEMGVNGPTIPSLRTALPNVKEIDRSNEELAALKQAPESYAQAGLVRREETVDE